MAVNDKKLNDHIKHLLQRIAELQASLEEMNERLKSLECRLESVLR